MPIYTYRTEDGETVERVFKMSDYPQTILLNDGREAKLVISLTAKMAINWEVRGTSSELPPENAPPINPPG